MYKVENMSNPDLVNRLLCLLDEAKMQNNETLMALSKVTTEHKQVVCWERGSITYEYELRIREFRQAEDYSYEALGRLCDDLKKIDEKYKNAEKWTKEKFDEYEWDDPNIRYVDGVVHDS